MTDETKRTGNAYARLNDHDEAITQGLSRKKRNSWLAYASLCMGALTAVATIPTNVVSGLADRLASLMGGNVGQWLLATKIALPILAVAFSAMLLAAFASSNCKPKIKRTLLWVGLLFIMACAAFTGALLYGAGSLNFPGLTTFSFLGTSGVMPGLIFALPTFIGAVILSFGVNSIVNDLKTLPAPGQQGGSAMSPVAAGDNVDVAPTRVYSAFGTIPVVAAQSPTQTMPVPASAVISPIATPQTAAAPLLTGAGGASTYSTFGAVPAQSPTKPVTTAPMVIPATPLLSSSPETSAAESRAKAAASTTDPSTSGSSTVAGPVVDASL
jgi:hypothetical protein